MGLAEVAQIVLPALTALGGGAAGARYSNVREEKAELRTLLDDAAATIERANRRRGAAYVHAVTHGPGAHPAGQAALADFRCELSEAAQIRPKLVMRTREYAPVSVHYLNALLALGRVSEQIGVLQMYSDADAKHVNMVEANQTMEQGEKDFDRAYADFLKAANDYMRPWGGRRWPPRKAFAPPDQS